MPRIALIAAVLFCVVTTLAMVQRYRTDVRKAFREARRAATRSATRGTAAEQGARGGTPGRAPGTDTLAREAARAGFETAAKDGGIWYEVGQRVLHGQPILHLPHYRYPPTFAVLIAPLSALPPPVYYFTWFGLNLALFLLCISMALRLAWQGPGPLPARLYWLPALLVATYAFDTLLLGQVNVLITALFYWGLRELERGREWLAGLPIATTIAMKVFTLPWVAYLLFRRRWAAAASTLLVTAFLLVLLPAPARGFHRNLAELADWGQRVVAPYASRGEAGDWGQHGVDLGNQSLQAVLHRLFTPVNAGVRVRHESLSVHVADLSEAQVNLLLLACLALLAAGLVWTCGWQAPRDPRARAAEFGLCVILLLLASALAWTYFFVMLLLPIAVALMLLYRPEGISLGTRRLLLVSLWVQGLAVPLMARHFGGAYFRAAGSICWASVLLYVALAKACWDLRRAEARQPV